VNPDRPEALLQVAPVDGIVALSALDWRADVDGIRVRELLIEERRYPGETVTTLLVIDDPLDHS
jgi:hypothetical protein